MFQTNSKSINGLVEVDSNLIYSDYYNDISSTKITYLKNVSSDIQTQINNINTAVSTGLPTFSIGTVVSGSPIAVSISGTQANPILNFVLSSSDNSYSQSISGNLYDYIVSNNNYVVSLSGSINNNNTNITTVSGNLSDNNLKDALYEQNKIKKELRSIKLGLDRLMNETNEMDK